MSEVDGKGIGPLGILWRGVLMGAADVVPGVSGGTVALIVGIYERLVQAVSRFDRKLLQHARQRDWTSAAGHIDALFLLPLLMGVGLGVVSLGSLMHTLLDDHRGYTYAAFFGLVAASAVVVLGMIKSKGAVGWILLAVGIVAAFLLTGPKSGATGSILPVDSTVVNSYYYLFFSGFIAISAMILPGISGSYILLLLDRYDHVLEALKDIVKGVRSFAVSPDDLITMAVFGLGCLVGILSFSKVLRWLLARFHDPTLFLLCGFMVGSLRMLWPFKESSEKYAPNILPTEFSELGWPLLLAVIGFVLVLGLERIGHVSAKK